MGVFVASESSPSAYIRGLIRRIEVFQMIEYQPRVTCTGSIPNDIFLHRAKFKALAENKLNVAKIMTSVYDRVENIVGKRENAGYQHFLFFPQCFKRSSFLGSLKVETVW